MVRVLFTVPKTSSISEVVDLMSKHEVKRIIVASEGKGIGIITEKDVVRFASTDTTERTLDEVQASEVMSTPLTTIQSGESISQVSKLMLREGISSVVVSDGERLEGILSKSDLCNYYATRFSGCFAVKDFMTKNVFTVKPSHSVFYAAKLMNEHKVSRLIVKEIGMKGIVTYTDLVSASPSLRPRRLGGEEKFYGERGLVMLSKILPSLSVADVMTCDPIAILQDEDLSEAARQMQFYKISGLPVLNNKLELVGIITKTDIVKALTS